MLFGNCWPFSPHLITDIGLLVPIYVYFQVFLALNALDLVLGILPAWVFTGSSKE